MQDPAKRIADADPARRISAAVLVG